ncbi:MAG: class I SAM-dependent methyltransferase, partial [Chloroflexota bacterium]
MRLGSHYRALIARRLGIAATGAAVLDVGAGDGNLLAQLSATLRVALDPSWFQHPGVRVVQGDGRFAPFPDASFDTVLALDVLEHVEDDAALVRELLRVTKPGGTVWISVPTRDHMVCPAMLTPWLHRRWGHVRPGYRLPDLLALVPDGIQVNTVEWNEPWFRALYVPLRALTALIPPLAGAVLPGIARWDGHAVAGNQGHYFLRVA